MFGKICAPKQHLDPPFRVGDLALFKIGGDQSFVCGRMLWLARKCFLSGPKRYAEVTTPRGKRCKPGERLRDPGVYGNGGLIALFCAIKISGSLTRRTLVEMRGSKLRRNCQGRVVCPDRLEVFLCFRQGQAQRIARVRVIGIKCMGAKEVGKRGTILTFLFKAGSSQVEKQRVNLASIQGGAGQRDCTSDVAIPQRLNDPADRR
jgi:hypothetical protein